MGLDSVSHGKTAESGRKREGPVKDRHQRYTKINNGITAIDCI